MNWIFLGFIAISGIFFTVGDVSLKYWAEMNMTRYLFGGFASYCMAATFLGYALSREKLAVAIVGSICFNIVAGTFAGYVLFGEELVVQDWVGVVGGIALVTYVSL